MTEPRRRKITALILFRDRVVQNAIFAAIEPIWEARFISGSYACRIGKGTHAGANKAQEMLRQCLREHGEVFVLKADISKYFASIDHEILIKLLRRRIADKRIMAVIEEIIRSYSEPETPGKGIPIGNLTSQMFANIYLDALDQWIKCRRQERWYVRYMDDWIVVHPDKRHLQALRIDAEAWLADNLELQTNHKTLFSCSAPRWARPGFPWLPPLAECPQATKGQLAATVSPVKRMAERVRQRPD